MRLSPNQSAALRWMAGTGDRGARAFHAKWTHRDGRKAQGALRTLWSLGRMGLVDWADTASRTGWVITPSGRERARMEMP